MEPLSVAADVIAVLQAANAVISICYDFQAAIQDAPWALTRITGSINELRIILTRLEQVAHESELCFDETSVARLTTLQMLCKDGGVINNCLEELTGLAKKLTPGSWAGKEGSKRRALIQSVGWQFKGKDAEETLRRLDGYKNTLNLAMTMDQTALLKDMSKKLLDIDENTRSFFKQFEDLSVDERKRTILQWLSPVDPFMNHEASLKIRQAGTNDWFLRANDFEAWKESKSSFLWLSGFPGSGKTILMSTLIEYLQRTSQIDVKGPALLAYFYCDFRSPETRDTLNLAGSLLAQVCFKLGYLPASLDAAFDRCKMSGSPHDRRISLETITDILAEISLDHRLIVTVDGLDECEKRSEILSFFRELQVKSRLLNILVSSRDETDIREVFSEFPRLRLESASASLQHDIDSYINFRLSHDRSFKWLKESFQKIVCERLSTQARGMFRWVQCQLDQIAKLKTIKDIRQALDNLPHGLQETYENILKNVDPGCVDIVRQTLEWLVCDVTTMTLVELHECLAIGEEIDHIDEEAQLSSPTDIYDLCGSFITVTADGEVILAHLSVKDYLLSDSIKLGKASAFALSLAGVNEINACRCLTYLSFADFQKGPCLTPDDFENRLNAHPFYIHASKWWPSYVKNVIPESKELQTRVLQFLDPKFRSNFMSWLQVICSEVVLRRQDLKLRSSLERRKRAFNYYPKHATSLYYAASYGIEYAVIALLEQGAIVDEPGGRLGATPFHSAALRDHVKIMDILYQKGADPNKMDFIKKTPLISAALIDNVECIRYLLDHGADPDAKDDQQKTAYDWAAMLGHDEAMKLLKIGRAHV